ncbi:MAG: hypothetical protein FWD88_02550 [Treponema sp.]|nr:hypothetical protein [Treponema sp.]
MNTLAGNMARALPFNASMGLNWSDAHIGKFFPSMPPRFGGGVVAGFTVINIDPLQNLLDMFGFGDLTDWGGFPLPGGMVEGRIGGFFLPFDIGVKVGFLPVSLGPLQDNVDYFLIGADIRYEMYHGNSIIPMISLGFGVNHLRGGLWATVTQPIRFNYTEGGVDHILRIEDPRVGISWETTAVDFKAQASWQMGGMVPYIGVGASHGWSRVSYGLTEAGIFSTGDLWRAREALYDEFGIRLDDDTFSSGVSVTGWNLRAFGGLSFLLPLRLRLDLTGMWDFMDSNFGATIGIRMQI